MNEIAQTLKDADKRVLCFLVKEVKKMYGFKSINITSTTEENVSI